MASKSQWIIGSDPDCDVVVERPTVSGRHCRLEIVDRDILLEDLNSTNGTFVNGTRVEGCRQVSPADNITMGSDVSMPWPSQAFPDCVTIGRDSDNGIILDVPMVSSEHAQIVFEQGRPVLIDLGSTNGTAIGSPEQKTTRATISPGDVVYFGSYSIPATELLARIPIADERSSNLTAVALVASEALPRASADTPTSAGKSGPRTLLAAISICALLAVVGIAVVAATRARSSAPDAIARSAVASASDAEVHTAIDTASSEEAIDLAAAELSPVAIEEKYADAIVWVGFRHKGVPFLYATGWALESDVIVTSGYTVHELNHVSSSSDIGAIVYNNGEVIPVRSFRVHPKFEHDNPTNVANMHYNIGAVVPEFPLDTTCRIADENEIADLSTDTPLVALGYASSLPFDKPYDRLQVKFASQPLRVTGTLQGSTDSQAALKIAAADDREAEIPASLEGAPVFTTRGTVIGVAIPGDKLHRMILADHVRNLVELEQQTPEPSDGQ